MTTGRDQERNVEDSRARSGGKVDARQDRPAVGSVGESGGTQVGSMAERALQVVRRNPISVILAVAGTGWLIRRMSQDRRSRALRRFEDRVARIPVLNTGNARVYDPDFSPRHPMRDSLESRRNMHARI